MSKKYIIKSFGCARRDLDAEKIKSFFESNNVKETKNEKGADYMVIVTCGVVQPKKENAINCIQNFKKFTGQLIIYGCLPAMDPEKIKEVYGEQTIITKDIDTLDSFIDLPNKFTHIDDANTITINTSKTSLITHHIKNKPRLINLFKKSKLKKLTKELKESIYSLFSPYIEGIKNGIGFNNKHFTIRVSEGCLGNCSYCTIKYAIGKLKSKPIDVIKRELQKAIDNKQFKLNIIASDTGAYGLDTNSNLTELLNTILNANENFTIEFIQDLHPLWISKYKNDFLEIIKTKRIKSILTAVQSGNPRILKLMKRYDNTEEIIESMQSIKKVYPELRIRTQVIVGFPSETEEEFQDTINLINLCKFDEVDIYCYNEVKDSDSININPKISDTIIIDRANILIKSLKVPYRFDGPTY